MFFGALQIYLQQLCQLQNVLIIIIVNLVYNKDSLVSGVLNNLWLYWSATFIGTSVIAFMFRRLFTSKKIVCRYLLVYFYIDHVSRIEITSCYQFISNNHLFI